MRLALWTTPGARRTELAGVADGRLRVRVAAPAHEGRANAELRRFIAERLGVPPSDVAIVAGAGARRKVLQVQGVAAGDAAALLGLEED